MDIKKIINESEIELKDVFIDIDNKLFNNSEKVLNAFHHNEISEACFNSTTGYGYGDLGEKKLKKFLPRYLAQKTL